MARRSPPKPSHYDVFISHSSRRQTPVHDLVDKLASALERRGLHVFLDRRDFAGGEALIASLTNAIGRSRVGLVILTHMVADNAWIELEMDLMVKRRHMRRMEIRGLEVEPGCPPPPGLRREDVIVPLHPHDVTRLADQVAAAIRGAMS